MTAEEGTALPCSLAGGLDYATAYFHRGYLQQSGGAVLQPYATVATTWQPNERAVVRPYLTFWNSTGGWGSTADSPMGQYLSELMGGVYTTWDALAVDLYYNLYFYPAMSFAQEGGAKCSYDVTALWREPDASTPFSLRPFTAIYYGSLDQIGMGNGYFEVGIEPAWRIDVAGRRIGISFPTNLGTNIDGYYFDAGGGSEFLGFYATGVSASLPLPIDSAKGRWFLTGSVQYLHLIADNLQTLNHGHPDMVIGKVGIGFMY